MNRIQKLRIILGSLALITWALVLFNSPIKEYAKNLNRDFSDAFFAYFFTSNVPSQNYAIPMDGTIDNENTFVIDDSSTAESSVSVNKRIEVDLTHQTIYAYADNVKVYEFPVSTGWWSFTPVGEFKIWSKQKYVLMSGGSTALGTYYYLPGVPYTMFFYNDEIPQTRGYGLHGTYWHDNFGHPMSHGCVNLKTEDAEKLFYWVDPPVTQDMWGANATDDNPGTTLLIYGITPTE